MPATVAYVAVRVFKFQKGSQITRDPSHDLCTHRATTWWRPAAGIDVRVAGSERRPCSSRTRMQSIFRAALETLWRHIQSFVPLVRLLSCVRRYGNPTAVSWVSLVDLTEHCLSFLWCNLKKSRDLHKLFSLGSNRGRVAFRLDAFQALRCVRARHCPPRLVGPDRCTCGRRRCFRVFPSI